MAWLTKANRNLEWLMQWSGVICHKREFLGVSYFTLLCLENLHPVSFFIIKDNNYTLLLKSVASPNLILGAGRGGGGYVFLPQHCV